MAEELREEGEGDRMGRTLGPQTVAHMTLCTVTEHCAELSRPPWVAGPQEGPSRGSEGMASGPAVLGRASSPVGTAPPAQILSCPGRQEHHPLEEGALGGSPIPWPSPEADTTPRPALKASGWSVPPSVDLSQACDLHLVPPSSAGQIH